MCIDSQISHLWDEKRKWCKVLSLLPPSSRQWADPTKEPVPFPLGPSYGQVQEWWQFGKWFVPHTHKSCLQQWGNGRAGPDPTSRPPHCSVLQGVSFLLSHCLRPSEWSRASHFLFPFLVHSRGQTNAQITLCDHRVICKSHFWGTHAS